MSKTIDYYMGLPYTIELWRAEEGGWVVRVKELPGCVSQGETPEEAIEMIQDAMQGWLEVSLEMGDAIPEPRPEEDYSGKFVVRVPKSLHRQLVDAANREGVSLNQYINVALALKVGDPMADAVIRPAGASPSADAVWPGLHSTLQRVLVAAGYELAACELDERLFADWARNALDQVAAALAGNYGREALIYLSNMENVLRTGVDRSPAVSILIRACEMLRDQVQSSYSAPLAILRMMSVTNQRLSAELSPESSPEIGLSEKLFAEIGSVAKLSSTRERW
jgi:antitoxin HicB